MYNNLESLKIAHWPWILRKEVDAVIHQSFLIFLLFALASFEVRAQEEHLMLSQTNTSNVTDTSQPSVSFHTKYAYFEPASFNELPGWKDDNVADAWPAFRQSCNALRKKIAWKQICIRSTRIDGSNEHALRQFFEQEFTLYQIYDVGRTQVGVITGYYEPLLNGNRRYGSPYVYPVFAVPDDMLYLDSRTLPTQRGADIQVRVEGRKVIPVSPPRSTEHGIYKLEVNDMLPDIRTRKLRLRVDGESVVPYFSRQEIDSGQMSDAKVIVWVDNPAALYSMHIQGSGKIRLPDGEIIRVAYGEQNGYPFNPSLLALPQMVNSKGKRKVIATRGLGTAFLQEEEDESEFIFDSSAESQDSVATIAMRGLQKTPRLPVDASEVDRVIEALLPGGQFKAVQGTPDPRLNTAQPLSQKGKSGKHAMLNTQRDRTEEPFLTQTASPVPPFETITNNDPSYVFFRTIPNNNGFRSLPVDRLQSILVLRHLVSQFLFRPTSRAEKRL